MEFLCWHWQFGYMFTSTLANGLANESQALGTRLGETFVNSPMGSELDEWLIT